MLGAHPLKSYSQAQSRIAQSSADAELYAMVRADTDVLEIQTLLSALGVKASLRLQVDDSAALGMAQMQGQGCNRHHHTDALRRQRRSIRRSTRYAKVAGTCNPAGMQSKYVHQELCVRHMQSSSRSCREGRAVATAQLHALHRKLRQVKSQLVAQRRAVSMLGPGRGGAGRERCSATAFPTGTVDVALFRVEASEKDKGAELT